MKKNITTCNLCNNDKFKVYISNFKQNRNIVKCSNCGLLTVDSMNGSFSTIDFEDQEIRQRRYEHMVSKAKEEGRFDEEILRLEEDIRTLHFKNRKEEIEQYKNAGRLLDIGCGRGFFLTNFIGSNIEYYGVEPRKEVSDEAKKRVGEDKIFCGTLKEANFPDSYFDVVTMINLIEHLPNPKENLLEVNRVMKEEGILFIETPNAGCIFVKLLGKHWHAFIENEHHYFFTKETLTRILKDTGFGIKKIRIGDKLFSIRYLLYRLNWYTKSVSFFLNRVLAKSNLLCKTIRIPQIDELIIIAKKVSDVKNLGNY